jgi:hypothetical protein
VALVVALATGCGGGGGGSVADDAAGIVPADALAFVTVDTNVGTGQLKNAETILRKFPLGPGLLRSLKQGLAANGGPNATALEKSIGPELDVAALDVDGKIGAVGYTRPKDEQAFVAALEQGSSPAVHTKIDGWTVFSDTQAYLDAVKHRKADLGDEGAYTAAMKTVPAHGDALARAYASTLGVQAAKHAASTQTPAAGQAFDSIGPFGASQWLAAALSSTKDAFKLEVHAKSSTSTATSSGGSSSDLAAQIPSGSIVALSLRGGSSTVPAQTQRQLGALSSQLGIDLQALIGAFNGPVAAYVRAGLPLPEVTIVAKPKDPRATKHAIGQLIAKISNGQAAPVPTKVDGGILAKVDLGSVALYYGNAGAQAVVTDSANALAELKGSVGHLSDDGVFQEARDGAGMPADASGFLFVDLKDAVPALDGFAKLANQTLPPQIEENLRPLRSLLVFGTHDGGVQSLIVYLKTS